MKVTRSGAVAMFEALGIKTASKWNSARLAGKLAKVNTMVDEETELEGDEKVLLDSVLTALEAGEEVELTDDSTGDEEGEEKPRKKSKKAKAEKGKTIETKETKEDAVSVKKAKTKTGKAGEKKTPSNKEVIYKEWKKAKDKSTKRAETYHSLVNEQVQLTTIRGWIGMWTKGKGLPACAKEMEKA